MKNAPISYESLFSEIPKNLNFKKRISKELDFIHLFVTYKKDLEKAYIACHDALAQNGILWISWPKGSSDITTDINRDYIREYVLENGLVDVKVCSVNDDWSALKFVYRLKDRI